MVFIQTSSSLTPQISSTLLNYLKPLAGAIKMWCTFSSLDIDTNVKLIPRTIAPLWCCFKLFSSTLFMWKHAINLKVFFCFCQLRFVFCYSRLMKNLDFNATLVQPKLSAFHNTRGSIYIVPKLTHPNSLPCKNYVFLFMD